MLADDVQQLVRHATDCVTAAAYRHGSSESFLRLADRAIAALRDLQDLDVPDGTSQNALVDRAVAHMRESHHEPLTVGALAAAAGVSTRMLNLQFQQHLNTTPSRYLRDLRLAAVRDSLLTADREGTVARAARRAGFGHLGRFASTYRARYGERPSQTLRRALEVRSRSALTTTPQPDSSPASSPMKNTS